MHKFFKIINKKALRTNISKVCFLCPSILCKQNNEPNSFLCSSQTKRGRLRNKLYLLEQASLLYACHFLLHEMGRCTKIVKSTDLQFFFFSIFFFLQKLSKTTDFSRRNNVRTNQVCPILSWGWFKISSDENTLTSMRKCPINA